MHRSIKEHPAYNDLIRQIKANDTRLRTPTRHGPSPRYDEWYQLLKHKQDLLYMQLEVWDELDLCYKYDPNQPRVPAGNSGGGQWTDAGGGIDPVVTGATLAQSASKPATGSWIGRAEQIAREIDRNIPLRQSSEVIRSYAPSRASSRFLKRRNLNILLPMPCSNITRSQLRMTLMSSRCFRCARSNSPRVRLIQKFGQVCGKWIVRRSANFVQTTSPCKHKLKWLRTRWVQCGSMEHHKTTAISFMQDLRWLSGS